jgi:hypothetical protein
MSLSIITLVGTCIYFAHSLSVVFSSNPGLNTLIIGLTFAGILFAFYQLYRLQRDAEILENLKQGQWSFSSLQQAIFLEPIIAFFQKKNAELDPSLAKRLGDSLADRLENERVFPRYLIGLLVFLGLLGTFWGLSQTISSIAKLIQNMPSDGGASSHFFTLLKENLQSPLVGMGTAFSSSLFGLGGSLLIGFLELQVGHAYGRFLNETDAYLTNCSHGSKENSALPTPPLGFLKALLTHNIESVDKLLQVTEKSERNEEQKALILDKLLHSLSLIAEQNKTQQNLMVKLAEGQIQLHSHFSAASSNIDEETLKCLQNIDRLLNQSLQHQREAREEFLKKLKDELRLIAHTMANVADQQKLAG